jgi:hypothetical protein
MMRQMADIAAYAAAAVTKRGHADIAEASGQRVAWLEACGYPGLKLLSEALNNPPPLPILRRDALGMDLHGVSSIYLADILLDHVQRDGRVFLRNVRHGLFLLPDSVNYNYGIGCPVDPGFALGGERTKNPYAEKLATADANGISVDEEAWQALA